MDKIKKEKIRKLLELEFIGIYTQYINASKVLADKIEEIIDEQPPKDASASPERSLQIEGVHHCTCYHKENTTNAYCSKCGGLNL